MSEVLLFTILLALIVMSIGVKARRDIKKKSLVERGDPLLHARALMTDDEARTRNLIGDESYEIMTQNVDNVLASHSSDRCQSIALSTGPDSNRGQAVLHTLLPGDPLSLKIAGADGVDYVDVYSDDCMVGRLMLTAAEKAIELLETKDVTGVYVAEQNCYGDSDTVSLRLIIFYHPRSRRPAAESPLRASQSNPALYSVTIPEWGRALIFSKN